MFLAFKIRVKSIQTDGCNGTRLKYIKEMIFFNIIQYTIGTKGQLISKGLFGVFNSSNKRTKTSRP